MGLCRRLIVEMDCVLCIPCSFRTFVREPSHSMKYPLLLAFFTLCLSQLFAQESSFPKYHTTYEQEVLLNRSATHLELLLAMGPKASRERTAVVKQEFDVFINEIKSSDLLRRSEVKLMKELHRKVHERFLTRYKYISPFHEIFETGEYNCVSATALFALVLEELNIPYNIQEQPNHVYIMAYPDTKAISVEMTAIKDAYYLPPRKDVSKAVGILVELGLTTQKEVQRQGALQVYNTFYNTNSEINLRQLCGIQYFNEAITAANENDYAGAFDAICKTEAYYNVEKTRVFKREVLYTLLDKAKFDCLRDIGYLVEYANLKKTDHTSVYFQYAKFLHEQLITKRKRELADSSHIYIVQRMKDTAQVAELNGLYYIGLSEYYSNTYNPKKQLEYAELAYKSSPDGPGVELWFTQSLLQSLENYEGEELVEKMDEYGVRYPFLQKHNLFLKFYFYAYVSASNDYYSDDDGENGKKYFDLAIQTMNAIEDKEVLEQDHIGWLYAEVGSYLARRHDYQGAINILEEGLKLAPGHEHLLRRIDAVKMRM